MEVNPVALSGGISSRLAGFNQTGNNALRHLGIGSGIAAVQDGLIQRKPDSLANGIHELSGKINVAVFEVRIADFEVSCHFEAVNLNIIEPETQLIDVRAALCPDCLRDSPFDDHAAFAVDGTNRHMLVQLGISFDILTQDAEHHFRDGQANIVDSSLLADGFPHICEVLLHIFMGDECGPLLFGHFCECFSEDLHGGILLPFFFGFSCRNVHVSRRRGVLFGFLVLKFFFKILDGLIEIVLLGLMCCLIGIVSINSFLYRGALFVGLCLVDGSFQFRFARLEISIFCPEVIQFFLGIRNFLTEQKSLECHHSVTSLFSFASISARHVSVFRFRISAKSAFLAETSVAS